MLDMPIKRAEAEAPKPRRGLSTPAIIVVILFVLIIIAGLLAFALRQLRARRLGLPVSYNPFGGLSTSRNNSSSSSSGPLGWIKDRLGALRNPRQRTAGGYEEPLGAVGGRRSNRGFGALDPDEAWDARVGNEADGYGPGGYYEEQELGVHGSEPEPYEGHRGRSRDQASAFIGGSQPGLDQRYYEETGQRGGENPFDDPAEPSHMPLRSLSPRPAELDGASNATGPAR
ncbi:MAG: hypothetical protein M1823_001332 [Watsoniomyces obsoletus]|nr:MAG: hypothetical protein M1823_001332 [Watsoniomyces obsoletus]